ncbi:hypothetical protein BJX66DRAFT_337458 [Aspergillus keveii]|uniref:Uncharacterized protein n=1 Tax=Aspergillus keveii TaxID=714993 RepID=A0ABR4G754_9EURO
MLYEFFSVIERIHLYPETFIIRPGGAHNLNDVMRVLTHDERHLVTFTIGNKPKQKATKAIRTSARREGMETLLAALSVLRNEWDLKRPPLLCVATTTGISDKRDILLVFYSLYLSMLVVPHRDKKRRWRIGLWRVASGLCLLDLVCCGMEVRTGRIVGVGVADVRTGRVERKAVGYTISREAVGEWMFENLAQRASERVVLEEKAVTLTF